MSDLDYLIVGAGAAGSVLANRLTASGGKRVLLLEAGADIVPGQEPADIRNVFPLSAFNPRYMWPDTLVHWRGRDTSPLAPLPQGRIVGGSSAVMGMWAIRGHPNDYDEWAEAGATGWDWEGVLPYFRRLETDCDFDGPMHGRDGPLPIRREREDARNPVSRTIHAAARARGWADVADMNGSFEDGHCALAVTREEKGRASAGLHYLTAAVRARANLTLRTDCAVDRLLIEDGRVAGVLLAGGEAVRARTTIVTAGALRTPVLLMRSGIGDPEMLRSNGVEVRHALAGVGRNLQNHAALYIVGMLNRAGLDPPGWRPAGSTYMRWTSGLPGTPPLDVAMYVRSYLSWHALGKRMASLAPCLMRPASVGQISLEGGKPLIEFDMLSDPRDLQRMKDAFRFSVAMFGALEDAGLAGPPVVLTDASGLARYNAPTRWNAVRAGAAAAMVALAPPIGRAVLGRLAKMSPARALAEDDSALTEFALKAVSGTGHVCGTARMGAAGDPLAVVDPSGHAHGLPGLMVADASVMPAVPSGNTHLPVVMVAEKIAAGLTGDVAA